jgi:folate-binding protein YgfZ
VDLFPLSHVTASSRGYLALRHGAAVLDLSPRGKIAVTGEDRARLLHAMTTNQVEQLKPGEGCYLFFLNAQGRIVGDANLFCFEDHLLLDTEPETRSKLFQHLDRYIIADDVTLEDQTEAFATLGVEGPGAGRILSALGAPLPAAAYGVTRWETSVVARVDSTGSPGFFLFVPVGQSHGLLQQLERAGAVEATPEEARTVRLENGRPRYGEEISERYLVQETGQLQAVNFQKGCYLGQEIVERVRSRAQIHRVLQRLEIETVEPPAPGTKLKAGDSDAAEISSAAFSPELGKVVALAYVRVQYAEPGTELLLAGTPARVVPAAA